MLPTARISPEELFAMQATTMALFPLIARHSFGLYRCTRTNPTWVRSKFLSGADLTTAGISKNTHTRAATETSTVRTAEVQGTGGGKAPSKMTTDPGESPGHAAARAPDNSPRELEDQPKAPGVSLCCLAWSAGDVAKGGFSWGD